MKVVYYNTEGIHDKTILEVENNWLKEQGLCGKYQLVRIDGKNDEKFMKKAEDADGIVIIYFNADQNALRRFKTCKVLATQTIGLNQVDLKAAKDMQIEVCGASDYCVEEVAEHTTALWLSCVRRIAAYNQEVRLGKWEVDASAPVHRIAGKTFGMVSFGRIPKRVAELLKGFKVRITAYDPFEKNESFENTGVTRAGSLEELFTASDYVSIHAPLTRSTYHMIGYELLSKMKKDSVILSLGRGGVLDEDALADAIEDGTITAAGLDVLENEPLVNRRLIGLRQVVITPHVAYCSMESIKEVRLKAIQNVVRVLEK